MNSGMVLLIQYNREIFEKLKFLKGTLIQV